MLIVYNNKINFNYLDHLISTGQLYCDDILKFVVNHRQYIPHDKMVSYIEYILSNNMSDTLEIYQEFIFNYIDSIKDGQNDDYYRNINKLLISHDKDIHIDVEIAKKMVRMCEVKDFLSLTVVLKSKEPPSDFKMHIIKGVLTNIDDMPAFIDLIKSSKYGVDLIHVINIDQKYKPFLINAKFEAKIYAALCEKYNDLDYFHQAFKINDTLPTTLKDFIESRRFLLDYHPERMAFINEYIKHNKIFTTNFHTLPFLSETAQMTFIIDNIYQVLGNLNEIKYLGDNIKKFVGITQINLLDCNALKKSIYAKSIISLLNFMDVSIDDYTEKLNENFDIKASLLKVTGLNHIYDSIQLMDLQEKPFDIYNMIKNDVNSIKTMEFDPS